MSGITIATRSVALTISRSGRVSMGLRTASRKAAASSARPSTKRGVTTVTFSDAISASSPSFPY